MPQEEARHLRAPPPPWSGKPTRDFSRARSRNTSAPPSTERPDLVGEERAERREELTFRSDAGARNAHHATTTTRRHLAACTAKGDGAHPRTPLAAVVGAASPPEAAASTTRAPRQSSGAANSRRHLHRRLHGLARRPPRVAARGGEGGGGAAAVETLGSPSGRPREADPRAIRFPYVSDP